MWITSLTKKEGEENVAQIPRRHEIRGATWCHLLADIRVGEAADVAT